MGDVIEEKFLKKLNEKDSEDQQNQAIEILKSLPKEEQALVGRCIASWLLEEIRQGTQGKIGYEEGPFFALVDKIYEELQPKGCYFCDPDIDPNELEFNRSRDLCMTCRLKVANVLQAFGVAPGVIGIPHRKVQRTQY